METAPEPQSKRFLHGVVSIYPLVAGDRSCLMVVGVLFGSASNRISRGTLVTLVSEGFYKGRSLTNFKEVSGNHICLIAFFKYAMFRACL